MATTVKGCCPLDCQDSCAWVAHVEDGRVSRVEGAKDHPVTRGVLCAKVKDYEARLTAPDRLLHPMRRVGVKGEGRFQRVSWDEALDEIATRFRGIIATHGAEALMPFSYLGSMGVVQRFAPLRIFSALGATTTVGAVCAVSAGAVGAEGHPISVDTEEAVNAELILLWGQNTLTTAHHQWHFIDEARKKGAKVICIDPRETRTARASDRHLRIIPGSDAVLAAGMARVLLTEGLADREFAANWAADLDDFIRTVMDWTLPRAASATGLAEADIVGLARAYGKARPALIRGGIAPMQTIAGETYVRSLSALAILGGHWRLPGGGLSMLSSPDAPGMWVDNVDLVNPQARQLDMARLGEILSDTGLKPPVQGLMVWSANPALTQPDAPRLRKGLAREDLFTVVFDHFITDTALYADIVLPATTQFEHFDVQGAWGHYYVTANLPAISPMGEAVSGGELMRRLAARLGLEHPALHHSDEEIAAAAMPQGISLAELKARGWIKVPTPRLGTIPEAAKLRLLDSAIAPPPPAPQGALQLVTPKSHYFLNSTFANMPRQRGSQGPATIEIHPDEAARRNLAHGDTVLVKSHGAEMRTVLKVTGTIRPGLAVLEGKWWGKNLDDAEMNRFTASRWSPAGQPAYNETYVEIESVQLAKS